jgi:hypothetical protein
MWVWKVAMWTVGLSEDKQHSEATVQEAWTPSWALVARACNSSYSGGRDQEDQGSKPAQANSL